VEVAVGSKNFTEQLASAPSLPARASSAARSTWSGSTPARPGSLTSATTPASRTAQSIPRDNVRTLDTGAIYAATDAGACNFGEIFTTDGRLKALGLTVLTDDRHFFPAYNVAPVVQADVLERHPQLEQVLGQITPLLTDEVLIELNRRVDVDGEEPADVALAWMRSKGLVS
jgi:glycine betaine/choline ABC-type transport system substrate-binding protein